MHYYFRSSIKKLRAKKKLNSHFSLLWQYKFFLAYNIRTSVLSIQHTCSFNLFHKSTQSFAIGGEVHYFGHITPVLVAIVSMGNDSNPYSNNLFLESLYCFSYLSPNLCQPTHQFINAQAYRCVWSQSTKD